MEMTPELVATLAPNFSLEVQGKALKSNVTKFIERVEYESVEGVVDMMKVSVIDPEFFISTLKLFLPGNELSLWIGYGPKLTHIGRAVIVNVKATYPVDGMPTMDVVGYSRSHYMQDVRPDPDPPPDVKPTGGQSAAAKKTNWKKEKFSEVVKKVAAKYQFGVDVDDTKEPDSNIYQPKEMSDFDLVKGLANLSGYYFWVDGDDKGKWTLHFKHPDSVTQEKKFTLVYSQGSGTLFSFEPELMFKDHFTKIQAQHFAQSGEMVVSSFVEEKKHDWSTVPTEADEKVEGEIGTAQEVNLFIGEYSFRTYDGSRFKDPAALEWWAKRWFERNRENFVSGAGECVGIPELRARQTHEITGLGPLFDGDWIFNKVRHIFDSEGGYSCEIDARKAVKK